MFLFVCDKENLRIQRKRSLELRSVYFCDGVSKRRRTVTLTSP